MPSPEGGRRLLPQQLGSAVRKTRGSIADRGSAPVRPQPRSRYARIARIAPGVPLENLVMAIAQAGNQAANAPEAVQEIVAFGGYKPGESGNIVFAKTLDPGRYGLFCFFPDVNDPEQTPHALKGMYAEFSVPG